MESAARRILAEREVLYPKITEAIPEVIGAWGGLQRAVLRDGALSLKTKELIALGMGIVKQCKYCIVNHARACLVAGATRDEICEVFGVALLMGGGPAGAYSRFALGVVDELLAGGDGTQALGAGPAAETCGGGSCGLQAGVEGRGSGA